MRFATVNEKMDVCLLKLKRAANVRKIAVLALFFCVLFSAGIAGAADPAASFPGLSVVDLNGIRIYYHPELTEIIKKVGQDDIVRVLRTRIDRTKPQNYVVDFDPGPSEDPAFVLYTENGANLNALVDEKGEQFIVAGLTLIIPGNGSLYVSGHTNNMFNERRKFEVTGNRVREVPQPFYYVGLGTVTTRPVQLYSSLSKNEKDVVAQLPKGAKIAVLVNKGEHYLVKTSFGLVGWVHIPSYEYQTAIEGITYAGD